MERQDGKSGRIYLSLNKCFILEISTYTKIELFNELCIHRLASMIYQHFCLSCLLYSPSFFPLEYFKGNSRHQNTTVLRGLKCSTDKCLQH